MGTYISIMLDHELHSTQLTYTTYKSSLIIYKRVNMRNNFSHHVSNSQFIYSMIVLTLFHFNKQNHQKTASIIGPVKCCIQLCQKLSVRSVCMCTTLLLKYKYVAQFWNPAKNIFQHGLFLQLPWWVKMVQC